MSNVQIKIDWEPIARQKYEKMITRIPLFHREIAKIVVDKKAPMLAQQRGSHMVEEEDIVRAFFSEVPMTFYSLMIRLLDGVGFDYKKYEPK
ncbi:MAG: hypothetical protein HZA28_01940 [Candidatus Omnitrophica bacterium]|nr:hypothetical protein [Candidatus Omnitrophota bacterium]